MADRSQYLNDTPLKVLSRGLGWDVSSVVNEEELAAVEDVLQSGQFEFEGIFAHFATAGRSRYNTINKQIEKFRRLVDELASNQHYVHYSNSAYALWHGAGDSSPFDMGLEFTGLILPMELSAERRVFLTPALVGKRKW